MRPTTMSLNLNKRPMVFLHLNALSVLISSSVRGLPFIILTFFLSFNCYSNTAGLNESNATRTVSDIVIDLEEYAFCKINVQWSVNLADQIVKSNLERSKDGNNFETINTVNHLSGMNTFSFNDKSAHLGKNYYRLKVYYQNGSHDYSTKKLLVLHRKKIEKHFLYPNPVSNGDFVRIDGYQIDAGKIRLFNMQGQLMISTNNLANGKLDISALKAGSYVVILDENSTLRKQILIKN